MGELRHISSKELIIYWCIFVSTLILTSAVVALLIDWVGLIEFPAQYAFVVPVVNTILYAIKEYVQKR